MSGHDFSVLAEMTLSLPKGNRGLRSRAVKRTNKSIPYAVGLRAAQRSANKKICTAALRDYFAGESLPAFESGRS